MKYTREDLVEAKRQIDSTLHKLRETIKTFESKENSERYKSQITYCLERNENNGIVYHREGINGDYDNFDDVESLIHFIRTGQR